MHAISQKAIIETIQRLAPNIKIKGTVRVTVNKSQTRIDISYDNRKYIGRLRLQLLDDKYLVYFMDKTEGKIAVSDNHSSKSAYMEIKNKADAVLFAKWYVILTQLATLKRNRA